MVERPSLAHSMGDHSTWTDDELLEAFDRESETIYFCQKYLASMKYIYALLSVKIKAFLEICESQPVEHVLDMLGDRLEAHMAGCIPVLHVAIKQLAAVLGEMNSRGLPIPDHSMAEMLM